MGNLLNVPRHAIDLERSIDSISGAILFSIYFKAVNLILKISLISFRIGIAIFAKYPKTLQIKKLRNCHSLLKNT